MKNHQRKPSCDLYVILPGAQLMLYLAVETGAHMTAPPEGCYKEKGKDQMTRLIVSFGRPEGSSHYSV
jgi:hypothetical protein